METFIINLALTALIYGIFPLILIKTRKTPITKGKLKLYLFIYDIAVWFIIGFISYDGTGFKSPAIIWWYIYYKVTYSQLDKDYKIVK